jgi:FMN phosphatase YigB (HAD superfamily)
MQLQEIKGLSFDMYRTLIDTKKFHEQAVEEILKINNAESVDADVFHTRWDEIYDVIYLSLSNGEFKRLYQVSVENLHLTMEEFGVKDDPESVARLWLSKYDKVDLYTEVQEVLNKL